MWEPRNPAPPVTTAVLACRVLMTAIVRSAFALDNWPMV
jgi:hypothetical protein